MLRLDKEESIKRKEEVVSAIKEGKIFIYPTDTIYGIGCDATNEVSVRKIREIKNREQKPFSVIAPSKSWILENCIVPDLSKLDLLPGPYTLILKMSDLAAVSDQVTNTGTLGVRMPNNWFTSLVTEAGIPFVTTSVNISGEKHMEIIDDVSSSILENIDFALYEGPIYGQVSTKIDLSQ